MSSSTVIVKYLFYNVALWPYETSYEFKGGRIIKVVLSSFCYTRSVQYFFLDMKIVQAFPCRCRFADKENAPKVEEEV